jgi:hypothetical protein
VAPYRARGGHAAGVGHDARVALHVDDDRVEVRLLDGGEGALAQAAVADAVHGEVEAARGEGLECDGVRLRPWQAHAAMARRACADAVCIRRQREHAARIRGEHARSGRDRCTGDGLSRARVDHHP